MSQRDGSKDRICYVGKRSCIWPFFLSSHHSLLENVLELPPFSIPNLHLPLISRSSTVSAQLAMTREELRQLVQAFPILLHAAIGALLVKVPNRLLVRLISQDSFSRVFISFLLPLSEDLEVYMVFKSIERSSSLSSQKHPHFPELLRGLVISLGLPCCFFLRYYKIVVVRVGAEQVNFFPN